MSSSSTSTSGTDWGTVVNNFISAIQNILADIGSALSQYAGAIASILIGVGIVYFIVRGVRRIPFISNFLSNFF